MEKDSPFRFLKNLPEADKRIGIRDVSIFFCEDCKELWRAGNAEVCMACKGKNILRLHTYHCGLPRV